jgi:hypothetical protein
MPETRLRERVGGKSKILPYPILDPILGKPASARWACSRVRRSGGSPRAGASGVSATAGDGCSEFIMGGSGEEEIA